MTQAASARVPGDRVAEVLFVHQAAPDVFEDRAPFHPLEYGGISTMPAWTH